MSANPNPASENFSRNTSTTPIFPRYPAVRKSCQYNTIAGAGLPNVKVTADPAKILTASFTGGKEIWARM
jgi:hypothetical protein